MHLLIIETRSRLQRNASLMAKTGLLFIEGKCCNILLIFIVFLSEKHLVAGKYRYKGLKNYSMDKTISVTYLA